MHVASVLCVCCRCKVGAAAGAVLLALVYLFLLLSLRRDNISTAILYVACLCAHARSVPPLVPFNLGSLGFLTPFDPASLEKVLHKTLRGN
jgi:hypothetical protein